MAAQPPQTLDFMQWTWDDIEPRYRELEALEVSPATVESFLHLWTDLADRIQELGERLHVQTDADTTDEEAARRYQHYIQEISPRVEAADQRLKEKLLASGLQPKGMDVPIQRMRVDVELFQEENLPLLSAERLLAQEYMRITGSQTVEWEGRQIPVTQVRSILEEADRERRELAWRLASQRRLQDREALDEVWRKLLSLRRRIAANAGFADYRAYCWRALKRFDYTPQDAKEFHRSVESVVVPVVARQFEKRRRRLGVDSLRPWDLVADVFNRPPLRPYTDAEDLTERTSYIFHQVDPVLGGYFDTMRREGLLDLDSRPNKAPGGRCTIFSASRRPFIFMNGSGTRMDVEALLHEGGHAFHAFEMSHLPYFEQRSFDLPMEFAEVGSMAMEFLTEPYLSQDRGGFYTREETARTRLEHLEERVLVLWCRLVAVDAFQHWVYEHPDEAGESARCDAEWAALYRRFVPGVDWSGLEEDLGNMWRDILHIFVVPFYIIEYGFAQLGAVQVWANAQRDRSDAVRRYRHALSLGCTRSLPELFAAAGAAFAFDEGRLREAVGLIERTIAELEREQERP